MKQAIVDKIEAHGRRAYRAVGPASNGLAVVCEAKRADGEWNAYVILQDGRCLGLRVPAAHSTAKARSFCESLRRMFYAPEEAREQYLAANCGEVPISLLPPVARAACFTFTGGEG